MTYSIILPDKKFRGFYKEAASEYTKRLNRFCKIEFSQKFDHRSVYSILVSPKGDNLTSVSLAKKLEKITTTYSHVTFFILSEPFISVNETWAVSGLTLPHDATAVLLLEQLFRAYKISRNETYHK
jgi:23S rRNA (pseudouridine1915-N3)-methyltransferase